MSMILWNTLVAPTELFKDFLGKFVDRLVFLALVCFRFLDTFLFIELDSIAKHFLGTRCVKTRKNSLGLL